MKNSAVISSMKNQLRPSDAAVKALYAKTRREPAPARFGLPRLASTVCAACLTLAIAALLIQRFVAAPMTQPGQETWHAVSYGTTTPDTYVIPRWDEMDITGRFPGIMVGGAEYTVGGAPLSPGEVGEKYTDAVAEGYDIYEDKYYSTGCELFAIRGVREHCALAVRYEGSDEYYPCANHMYYPATLGDLIDDLNLRQNLSFGSIYYEAPEDGYVSVMAYTLPDTSVIWELLLTDTDAANEGDAHYDIALMGISVDVALLGEHNISLAVTRDGYLTTNINATAKTFFIGEERVRAFVDYVLQNGDGVEVSFYYTAQGDDVSDDVSAAVTTSGQTIGVRR